MKICFVDTTKLQYSFEDINSQKIRGAESILINLSQKLSSIGLDIMVLLIVKRKFTKKLFMVKFK